MQGKARCLSFPSPWEIQTTGPSSGTLVFLSACLGIDSLSFCHSAFTWTWHSSVSHLACPGSSNCFDNAFLVCTSSVLLFTPSRGHAPQSMSLKNLPTCPGPNSWTWRYRQQLPGGGHHPGTTSTLLVLFSCSIVSNSSATPWSVARQTPLYLGFPRQEYCELPFPSPGDRPDPGVKSASPALAGSFFTTEPPGKLRLYFTQDKWGAQRGEVSCPKLPNEQGVNEGVLPVLFNSKDHNLWTLGRRWLRVCISQVIIASKTRVGANSPKSHSLVWE